MIEKLHALWSASSSYHAAYIMRHVRALRSFIIWLRYYARSDWLISGP